MESILLNAFSEQLSKIILGFRRDQINSSLLTGRGEITSVDLNCHVLNDLLRSYTPLVELESVHVTRLGFNVTSFANIKKAPVQVLIDEIHVQVVECLAYRPPPQSKTSSMADPAAAAAAKATTNNGLVKRPYGLMDRIGDNIHVEINRLFLTFQPLGKFKTRRTGPWTPPAVGVTLRNIRFVSVDEFGEEGTPEQVWRHNDRDRRQKRAASRNGHQPHDLFIYKKLTLHGSLGLRPPVWDGSGSSKPPTKLLLKSVPVEVNMTMQKRKTDAAFLAAQSDVVVDHVEVEMDHNTIPLLAQMAAAMQFLIAKDRSFVDPLKPEGNGGDEGDEEGIEMTLEEEEESEEAARKTQLSQGVDAAKDNGDVAAEADDADADDASESSSDEEDEEERSTPTTGAPATSATANTNGGKKFYPAYVFQSGIIIYDRISISLSVHHCSLRAWYPPSLDGGGYVQCVLKGLVTEAIWPPRPGDRGGIAQVSLSYISLQERHGKALRPLLYGGQQVKAAGVSAFNRKKAEEEKPDMMEAAPEITFPLFEDRSIRLDGYGRESLPSQAIGLKVTVDVQDHDDPAKRAEGKTQMSFLNECGMDRIDVILDAEAYCRVLTFCMNGEEGIDKRLFSGDWKEWISPDMFVSSLPSGAVPSLEPYLQPMPELFLDENHLISSELFNLTSKMTNIRLSLPAPVHKDVKTSSVVVCLSDMMVLVSSALPKTILSGVISPSSEDSDQAQSYPNDPSDISANISRMNEIMSAGVDTKEMRSSTFRAQVTMDGLTVEARPAIPLHDALECQSIILPTKISFLVCIDISAPPTAQTRKAMGIAVHLSAHLQKLQMNLDFDVVVGVVGCLIHHAGCFQKTIQSIFSDEHGAEKLAVDQKPSVEEAGGGSLDRVLKSQVSRSFEKGIVATLACIHIDELDVRVWRQECNIKTSDTWNDTPTAPHPVLLLARLGLKRLQLAGEAGKGLVGIGVDASRFTAKVGLTSLRLDLCDLKLVHQPGFAGNAGDGNDHISDHLLYMTTILSLGPFDENGGTDDGGDSCSFIRLDYDDESNSAAGSVDINSSGAFHLKLDVVQQTIAHAIEGLFIPTGIHQYQSTSAPGLFPDGSLGSFMLGLVNKGAVGEDPEEPASTNDAAAKKKSSLVDSIQALAFRFSAKDLTLFIPSSKHDEIDIAQLIYKLQLSNAECVLGYFRENDGRMVGSWSARKSGPDRAWSSEFEDYALGWQLRLNSNQCVSQITKDDDAAGDTLVRPFSISGAYHPQTAKMNMGPVELSFDEAQILQQIASTATGLGKNAYEIYLDVASLHSSLAQTKVGGEETFLEDKASPAAIASREAVASIVSAQSLLLALENAANTLPSAASNYAERNIRGELERAKTLLFLLERQRTAVLTLVSARVCGWIRMGASNANGQRMTTSTNLWRYWAVLRKNLLIVSVRPGSSKLIDIVPLREVTLHSITGQNRRTEVARGFALCDSRGYERVFSCATGEDCEAWVRSISEIAKKPHSATDLDNTESPTSIENDTQANSLGELSTIEIANPPRERLPSGESLPGNTDRRQLMKSKLSSVKDQTKNRMGAAVQSAKESQRGGRLMAKMAEAKASANAKLEEAKASANAKLEEAASAVRTASDISSTSGSGSPSAGERRVGRMSKLGAQVKSVKLDGAKVEKMTQAMKSVKLDGQALSRLNSASFQQPHPSFRSSGGSSLGENSALSQPALQVKSLQSLPLAPTVKQSDLPEVEHKRIPGTWNVNVVMVRWPDIETASDDVVSAGDKPTSADTSVEENQENVQKTKPFPWTYQITIQPLQTHHAEPTKKTFCRSLEDMLKFYTDIAQSIYSVRGYDSEYSLDEQKDDSVDFSSIDAALRNQLAVVSQVLHGVLELSKESLESEDVRNYQCEMLAAFANAVFSSPLPEDAIGATLAFFGLSIDFGIDAPHCLARYEYNSSQSGKSREPPAENNIAFVDLHCLISKCQSEFAKASRRVLISSSVSSGMPITTGRKKSGPESSALTFGSGNKVDAMQNAMHKALISAMTERDEAHSQLVASSVLHVTEMEEERKKNDRLTRKLVVAEKLNAETGAGGSFFLGKDEITQKHNISANAMQSSDEELLAMCRQLSNEIAEKTNASLEIVRLKESHKIERDAEKARREEMQNEINELKRQLAAEKTRRQQSEKETDKWQHSFKKAVTSDTNTESEE